MTSVPTSNSQTLYHQIIKLRILYVHIKPKSFLKFGGLTQRSVDMSSEEVANLSLDRLMGNDN